MNKRLNKLKRKQCLDLSYKHWTSGDIKKLANFVRRSPVTELNLEECFIGFERDRSCIAQLAQALRGSCVTTLNLSGNFIGDYGIKCLSQVLRGTQISILNFENNNITDAGAFHVAQGLEGSHIKTLNVYGNEFGDEGFKHLTRVLKETRMTDFIADDNRISVDVARYFNQAFCNTKLERYSFEVSTSLRERCFQQSMTSSDGNKILEIVFNYYDVGSEGAEYLNQLLREFPLHRLELSAEDLEEDHVEYLERAFDGIGINFLRMYSAISATEFRYLIKIFKNSHIAKIAFDGDMSSIEAEHVAEFLTSVSVTELSVSETSLNDDGIAQLAPALRNNTVLKLDLSKNRIGPTGIGYLAPVFNHNCITNMDLSDNDIGDPGVVPLKDCFRGSQLTHVDVSGNDVTFDGYQHLAARVHETNIRSIRFSSKKFADIERNENETAAYKIGHAFETLVGWIPRDDEFQFVLPKKVQDSVVGDYVDFIKTLTDDPQVKAHILTMMCFRNPHRFDFETMNKVNEFIGALPDKFNAFFNENIPNFPPCDYVDVVKKFEDMQLCDVVQNLLLHRELYYVDSNREILHPFVYKLLHKYKMTLYNEELEPNKKKAIIAFYANRSDDEEVQELMDLLRTTSSLDPS